ncbi:MAG: DUF4783 domain-containing protein [Bacteroidales bacterium]|nr:DUF4783 domain-containing protein [Bacteroidales bacterium]MDD2322441.1 DUF4783 domain-containing protein [Bacteroidales bacterium]MDD3010820.1 DUF4783 domain-containing protein [Bacteroidales bacterium]MDD3961647.1 DUF4783 domain-containing protein [Bacteroidales bacterium]HPE87014.1 DUF4783 domain-containing protein [Bacteroidales bacterium]
MLKYSQATNYLLESTKILNLLKANKIMAISSTIPRSLFLLIVLTLSGFFCIAQADATEIINQAIEKGNSKTLSTYFNTTLELVFPDNEGSYSKTQATVMAHEFFTLYPPTSFTIKHSGRSADQSLFCLGEYKSKGTLFRTYYLCREQNEKLIIFQLHFEKK